MKSFSRITVNPAVMGGKACIRGLRVTAGTVVGLLATGRTPDEILHAYPYLEREDINECLAYAAWRLEERLAADQGEGRRTEDAAGRLRTGFPAGTR